MWGTERKSNEEKLTEPRRPVGQHQVYNIQITGVPEREDRKKGAEIITRKIMAKTFQVEWKTSLRIQEA